MFVAGSSVFTLIIGGSVGTAVVSEAATVRVDASVIQAIAVPPAVSQIAAATCVPQLDTYEYDRTLLCSKRSATVTVLRKKTPVGAVTFDVTQDIQLNVRSRSFSEHIVISNVNVIDNAGGVHMTLKVSCGSPCTAIAYFPQDNVISAESGTISYYDSIGKGKQHGTKSVYVYGFTKVGYTPNGLEYSTPISYRCDAAFGQFAGCVFPEFTPTLTALSSLPDIAKNIKAAQNGPGHYGRPGSGHPLHHLTNVTRQRQNYSAVCARSVVGPPPKSDLSCDEYPFKTTYEGGTELSKANRRTAWVPTSEQNSQGGLITSFYNANRVLDGDAFWVSV
jgi:hypothetical protein